jgi:hypothetical protein
MRVLAAMMMLALAWAGQGQAQSPPQAPAAPAVLPAEARIGCYHTELRPCMISLGSAFWFDMDHVTRIIARRNELDVNGQTAHRLIAFYMKVPKNPATISIGLTLASPAPNDEVVKVRLTPGSDPDMAHTPSEYDRTLFYNAVSVVLGQHCANLDRLALYRFYENSIKPAEQVKTETRKYGIFHYTKQSSDTPKLPFCGAMFSLHRRAEFEGTPDMPNRKGQGLYYIDIE